MERKYYIDNLRILLTCLVVLHHLAITYGGPGLWYYSEVNDSPLAAVFLSLFVAINQSFFMGMFFMISAYFLQKGMTKKQSMELIRSRLKRLGIPLVFYALVLSPAIIFLIRRFADGDSRSFTSFLQTSDWLGFGPLWFVAALLIFTLFAVLGRNLAWWPRVKCSLPKAGFVLAAAVVVALISFVVRIEMPVGWTLVPFGFQLGHFPQYIFLFAIGFIASRNDWFAQVSFWEGKRWLYLSAFLVFVVFPLVFYFGGALSGDTAVFLGGWSWQSLAFCVWEQWVGFAIIMGLLGIFKAKFDFQNTLLKRLSAGAYTVYIIHAFVLVILSLFLRDAGLSSTAKFLLLAPLALLLCFVIAHFIRKMPLVRDIV